MCEGPRVCDLSCPSIDRTLKLYTSVDRTIMSDVPRILIQLAEALAVPIEAFTQVDSGSDERVATIEECIDLLDAFRRIGDRQARRRCLSYVKASAERSSDPA